MNIGRAVGGVTVALSLIGTSLLASSATVGAKVGQTPKPPPALDFNNNRTSFAFTISDSPYSPPVNGCFNGLRFDHVHHKGNVYPLWFIANGYEGDFKLTAKRTQIEMSWISPLYATGTATWNGSSYVGTFFHTPGNTAYFNFTVTVGNCP